MGQDCDDSDFTAYPNAVEICNGVFESCTHPDLQMGLSAPVEESDDDGDGYVECEQYDPNIWEGVTVVGGGDCNDVSAQTFRSGSEYFNDGLLTDLMAMVFRSVAVLQVIQPQAMPNGFDEDAYSRAGYSGPSR